MDAQAQEYFLVVDMAGRLEEILTTASPVQEPMVAAAEAGSGAAVGADGTSAAVEEAAAHS